MKKLLFPAVLLAAALLAGCGSAASSSESLATAESMVGTQIANPWVDYTTQKEAEDAAGFSIALPTMAGDAYAAPIYRAIPGQMLELQYGETAGDGTLLLRKALTADAGDDVTGDYNVYDYSGSLTAGAVTAAVRGQSADALLLASWQSGDYTYAIVSPTPLTADALTGLIADTQ